VSVSSELFTQGSGGEDVQAYYTDTSRCTGDDDRIPILDLPDILQTLLRSTIQSSSVLASLDSSCRCALTKYAVRPDQNQ
jgi:hypothetical protein